MVSGCGYWICVDGASVSLNIETSRRLGNASGIVVSVTEGEGRFGRPRVHCGVVVVREGESDEEEREGEDGGVVRERDGEDIEESLGVEDFGGGDSVEDDSPTVDSPIPLLSVPLGRGPATTLDVEALEDARGPIPLPTFPIKSLFLLTKRPHTAALGAAPFSHVCALIAAPTSPFGRPSSCSRTYITTPGDVVGRGAGAVVSGGSSVGGRTVVSGGAVVGDGVCFACLALNASLPIAVLSGGAVEILARGEVGGESRASALASGSGSGVDVAKEDLGTLLDAGAVTLGRTSGSEGVESSGELLGDGRCDGVSFGTAATLGLSLFVGVIEGVVSALFDSVVAAVLDAGAVDLIVSVSSIVRSVILSPSKPTGVDASGVNSSSVDVAFVTVGPTDLSAFDAFAVTLPCPLSVAGVLFSGITSIRLALVSEVSCPSPCLTP
jgi:hypothetical protein